jgi:hypothetical protein
MMTMDRRGDQPGRNWRTFRNLLILTAAVVIVAGATIVRAGEPRRGLGGRDDDGRHNGGWDDGHEDDHNSYAIGLWGDLPYSDA